MFRSNWRRVRRVSWNSTGAEAEVTHCLFSFPVEHNSYIVDPYSNHVVTHWVLALHLKTRHCELLLDACGENSSLMEEENWMPTVCLRTPAKPIRLKTHCSYRGDLMNTIAAREASGWIRKRVTAVSSMMATTFCHPLICYFEEAWKFVSYATSDSCCLLFS